MEDQSPSPSLDAASETDTNTSDESFEEEEEIEPRLKYERIGNDLNNILSKDAASCLAVHTKFMALGTHWGMIHIMDLDGNSIRNDKVPTHSTTVNQISIDANGDHLASCSDDGKVVIAGLYATDHNETYTCDRPVKAVALDPNYGRAGSARSFVSGEEKLVMSERGFLGRKTNILHQGEGLVRCIKWKGPHIAWANDMGVKVYHTGLKQRITYIARENLNLRPDQYHCNLVWQDETTLLIGWADSVKVCVVTDRPLREQAPDLPNKMLQIVSMFRTEFMVSGLAPYNSNLALLGYHEDSLTQEHGQLVAKRPQLRIVDGAMGTYSEVSNDALSVRNFEQCRVNDYHMECLFEDSLYFVVSPKDIVMGRPRDQDDHISWLLEHEKFEEALTAATEHSKQLKRNTFKGVALEYQSYLLAEEDFASAAQLSTRICGKDTESWETMVWEFSKRQQLTALAPYLPRASPVLQPVCYELTLKEFLVKDHQGFLQLVRDLPSHLYQTTKISHDVLDILERDRDNRELLQSLAILYQHSNELDKALGIYIRLKNPEVFDLIRKHRLMGSMSDKVILLMDFDLDRTVKLLLDHVAEVPVKKVVHQLDKIPSLLFIYLDSVYRKDASLCVPFHPRLVSLYADFDQPRLLSYLKSGARINLKEAMDVCRERQLIKEMVFLLDRMGNTKEALQLIMAQRDVDHAVAFCTEHTDQDLWKDLVEFSMDKPDFIIALLNSIGPYVDPIILIKKIQPGMSIPGLQQALVKILQDYNLQITLREVYRKILMADCHSLRQQQVQSMSRGVCVDSQQRCQACHERIVTHDQRYLSNAVVFYCKHVFHEECLTEHTQEKCQICQATAFKRTYGEV